MYIQISGKSTEKKSKVMMQKTPPLSGILLHIALLIFTEASSSVFVSQPIVTALYTVNIVKQSQNYKSGQKLNRRQPAMINVEQKGFLH